MIKVGQKVRFDPLASVCGDGAKEFRGETIDGTVVYVNEPHKWFSVEYMKAGLKFRHSFNFADIGGAVTVCG